VGRYLPHYFDGDREQGAYLNLTGRIWKEAGEYCIMSFITCTLHEILLG
jgi:hypothetical protein